MSKKINIEELSKLVGGKVLGDRSCLINNVGTIEDAKEGEITFVASAKNVKDITRSKASAFIIAEEIADRKETEGRNLIVVKDTYLALARVLEILRPAPLPDGAVSPKSEIHPSAEIGKDITIMAFAVIEAGVSIADNVVIYPGVYIARDSRIGQRTTIHANVSIRENTWIGSDVIIHANSTIGSDGFGYTRKKDEYIKIPQRGSVRIEDNCEIGSSVAIDRGTIGNTIIGKGTKIDNLVQIAHNVEIGENSIIVSQAGIAGSTKIGKRVQIGGQAGLIGHIKLGDDASVGASAAVLGDVGKGVTVSGYPAIPHNIWLRVQGLVKKLPDMKKNLKDLEERLRCIEKDKK